MAFLDAGNGEFDSIHFSHGDRNLLSNIYMSSETGRITGLLGRNGSGKTALMKIVFGATPLEQKSVRINSISLGTNYLRENVISYLPQQILIPAYASMEKAFSLFKIREEEITKHFREARNMA